MLIKDFVVLVYDIPQEHELFQQHFQSFLSTKIKHCHSLFLVGIPDGLDTAVDAAGSLALDIGKGFENLGNLIDNHVIGEHAHASQKLATQNSTSFNNLFL